MEEKVLDTEVEGIAIDATNPDDIQVVDDAAAKERRMKAIASMMKAIASMPRFKSVEERRREKLDKMIEKHNNFEGPEWKKAQLENKIWKLKHKIGYNKRQC